MSKVPHQPPVDSSGEEPSRQDVWRMFDRIAHRYDRLNRILSFRTDVRWRRLMADLLKGRGPIRLLDLATGTGDQIFSLIKEGVPLKSAVGMDLSDGMLGYGREKIKKMDLPLEVRLERGDAVQIPADDQSVDAVTISFGIRNVVDVDKSLREMHRVLAPGGRALILEFSMPPNPLVRAGYLFYLRHILPRVGAWISGDDGAYSYLNKTIETFPYGRDFAGLMKEAGFTAVDYTPMTFGIATVYQGDRAGEGTA